MSQREVDWTVEMLAALPDDGQRYEVIDGELFVTPAPLIVHQRAVGRLYALLLPYVDCIKLDILIAPTAVTFSNRREVQPDVLVIPRAGTRLVKRFDEVGELVLAVEVLSPYTERIDRIKKRNLYQDEGVPEYWIVDLDARAIERWRPESTEPEILTSTFLWKPLLLHEATFINVEQYFQSVFNE